MVRSQRKMLKILISAAESEGDEIMIHRAEKYVTKYPIQNPCIKQYFPKKEKAPLSLVDSLKEEGYLICIDETLAESYFKLTRKAFHRFEIQLAEFKKFVFKSIFVPIFVSFITTLITFFILG